MDRKICRRELIKLGTNLCGIFTASSVFSNVASALGETPAKKPLKIIDPEKNITAKSLRYTHDGAKNTLRKVDYALCGNCQLYKKKDSVDGVDVGSCQMIPGGYVKASGWCTSYVRDPKAFKK